jgi:trans-aconitate methyltransferase
MEQTELILSRWKIRVMMEVDGVREMVEKGQTEASEST